MKFTAAQKQKIYEEMVALVRGTSRVPVKVACAHVSAKRPGATPGSIRGIS